MMQESRQNPQDELTITDEAYQKLYVSTVEDHPGPEKGGACMMNTLRVAEYFIANGVKRDRLQFLYMVGPTPMGPAIVKPNMSALRPEELDHARKETGKVEWGYHAAIITKDTKQVFDLSAKKELWGAKLDTYTRELFLDKNGHGNHDLRPIITTLESLEEIIQSGKGIPVSELRKRGEKTGGGMTSIWMLQNKPEDEWYWND